MDEDRKISFYSDAAHNYMVLECPPGLKENYQYKMLAANRIKGLLNCSGRSIDSREYLYYDISSRQSLTDLYDRRPVRSEDLNRILKDLVNVEETLTEYLLDTSHLILDPACVYLDFREQTCSFVYYPGEEQKTGPQSLFTFLADRVDGRDKQAAALIYRLCMMAERPGFRLRAKELSDLGLQMDERSEKKPEALAYEQGAVYERSRKEEIFTPAVNRQEAVFREEYTELPEESPGGRRSEGGRGPILIAAAVLAAAGILLLLADRFVKLQESCILLTRAFGGVLTAAGVILLVVQLVRGRKKQTEQIPETAETIIYKEPEPWETPGFSSSSYRPGPAPGETCLLGPDTRPAAGLYGTGTCRGEQISLAKLPCVVGKMRDYVDQVLDDSSVSRMHARFAVEGDGSISVRDLNSTNGTWLNGERLRPNESRALQQGDHLRLGRMEFIFR
jgi:hypothetical protein